jgi:dTDP-4-dehydrorhamnose reductase
MRIAVTGFKGQVATSLLERAGEDVAIVALARPEVTLEDRVAVLKGVARARPDVVINAAAYTAVDKAESEESVQVKGKGAGHIAEAAANIGAPLLHLSTDYVFDGTRDRPYREDDPPNPTNVYGRPKLIGETLAAERCPNSVILRTAWVYSPLGTNFARTMLRLNETKDEVSVVADQLGNPTYALDIADAPSLGASARIRRPTCAAFFI